MQNKTKQKARKAIQAIMAKPGAFPLLCAHLRAGTLWLEGHDLVGFAADGHEVTIGTAFNKESLETAERYLSAHRNPATW